MSSNKIEFVFQNKVHQILNPDPNETVLNFVRSNLKKTGRASIFAGSLELVKEGTVILKQDKLFEKT